MCRILQVSPRNCWVPEMYFQYFTVHAGFYIFFCIFVGISISIFRTKSNIRPLSVTFMFRIKYFNWNQGKHIFSSNLCIVLQAQTRLKEKFKSNLKNFKSTTRLIFSRNQCSRRWQKFKKWRTAVHLNSKKVSINYTYTEHI